MPNMLIMLFVAIAVFTSVGLMVLLFGGGLADRLKERLDTYREKASQSLRRSGNPLSTERFARMQQALAGLMGMLGLLLGSGVFSRIFLLFVFGGCAWVACDRYLGILWSRYLKEFEEQLPDMIATVANAVKSGFSIQQAMEAVIVDFTPPLSLEMQAVIQEIRIGVPLDRALRNWSERLSLDDLDLFATALIIQRQTGGNLGEVLGNLGATMRERRKIQGQIRTLTSQGRASAGILASLPVLLFLALYLIAPERQGLLLTQPLGWVMISVSSLMVALAALIIGRIVSIDV